VISPHGISAQTTPIPDLWDFENIFAELDETPTILPNIREMKSAFSSAWSYILSYVKSATPIVEITSSSNGKARRPQNKSNNNKSLTRPAPYARLKNGSKSAIIAVVDNGTISFQRFGKSGFEELPWVGDGA
jgi:hypothetical protein